MNFDYRKYYLEKQIFNCYYKFEKSVDESLFLRILILFERHYFGYKIKDDFGKTFIPWSEFALSNGFKTSAENSFDLSTPLYISKNGRTERFLMDNGISITFGKDSYEIGNFFIFNLHYNLFTDVVYQLDSKRNYFKESQKIAASKNRKILSLFLKELEDLLEGEIIEYSSHYHLCENSAFKYGIKENAIHKTDFMKQNE